MEMNNFFIGVLLFVSGVLLGYFSYAWIKTEDPVDHHIIWQQGYNAGWSDALLTKKRLQDRENLNR